MAAKKIIPKTEIGRSDHEKFTDTGAPYGLKVGLITRVDEINLKADLKVITGGGDQFEIDLTQGMCGPRSFWGGVPEVGSIVIIGYRRKHKQVHQAVILGYVPVGARLGLKFDPVSPVDPSDVDAEDSANIEDMFGKTKRHRRLKLRPGDVGGLSSSGAELVLSKDVKFYNRAGDGIELRDVDRTLISQALHRIENTNGVLEVTGALRRTAMYLPTDIAGSDGTLLTEAKRYFGEKYLSKSGPGVDGAGYKFASSGKLLGLFTSNTDEFPPVTYSNGRRAFYPATNVAVNFEDPNTSLGASIYTERRVQVSHTTSHTQEVREEIDGFALDRPRPYIEEVMGTTVGNDIYSTEGMRHYGRMLKPVIFDELFQTGPGKFRMQEVPRSPHEPDIEKDTTAGGYMFKLSPPNRKDVITDYAFVVSKQGKVFLNVPGSTVERYPTPARNVSAEVNLEGALKMFIGAESSRNASVILDLAGGIIANVGHLDTGKAYEMNFGSGVDFTCGGVNDVDNTAYRATINGNESKVVTGDIIQNALGAVNHTANGGYAIKADSINHNASNGLSAFYGGMSVGNSGKSQFHYAQLVTETIVTQGKLTTILAGALVDTMLAGARTYNTLAGATSWNSPAGAYAITVGAGVYSVTVGGGAITMTAGAAVSMTAAAVMSLTSGGPMSLVSAAAISLISSQILLGGPAAVFGVARGIPMMPPGAPSLDWVTALPLMGCAVVRSF